MWWNICWILTLVWCFAVYKMLPHLLSHFILTIVQGDKQGRVHYPLLSDMGPRVQRGKGLRVKATFNIGLWLCGTKLSLPLERYSDCVQTLCSQIGHAYIHALFCPCLLYVWKCFFFHALDLRLYNLVYKHLQLELWHSVFQLLASVMCCSSWGSWLVFSLLI